MIDGECGVRCAGDQDQSWCWSAYGVSHHSLRWDLLWWPVGLSVAVRHAACIHQLVHHVLNDSGSSLLVAVGMDASTVTLSFDEPGEAGNVIAKLGELHILWLVLEHVVQDCESTCFPVLLQARIPTCVGHQGVRSGQSVVLVLALAGP